VQVRQEDLCHPGSRDLHRVVIDAAARTHIEHEGLAISELDKNAGALLIMTDDVAPACAHQGNTHLVLCQLLSRIVPQVRAGNYVLEFCS
jgi:hypothetical protein